jgi:hypothetical protein
MNTRLLLAALVGVALASPARAAERDARRDVTMTDLSASYNVQQTDIQSLRDKGWSWNDIGSALAISKRSGQPLQELVAQKDSGMSWSQIADKNGFRLSEVQRESRQVARDFRRADAQTKRGEAVRGANEPSGTTPSAPAERRPSDTLPERDRMPSDQGVTPGAPPTTPSAPNTAPGSTP